MSIFPNKNNTKFYATPKCTFLFKMRYLRDKKKNFIDFISL